MAQLVLENMEFYAFHGHYPEEQAIGGKYRVDLIIETNTELAERSDDLADTIDYSNIYQIISEEMRKPARIMEHLARRILKSIRNKMENIDKITIKLSKMHPPVGGEMHSFQIILNG